MLGYDSISGGRHTWEPMTERKTPGVITITTDFGHKGPFAAVMKGVIVSRFPDAVIIDLAHDIPAHWPPEAGFWISRSYSYFPAGSIHVAIVDPGVGTEREILIVEYDRHIFMAPDNGLLGPLLSSQSGATIYQLDLDRIKDIGVRSPSQTFHGRDIFAPVAAEFASGRLSPSDVGAITEKFTPDWLEEPEADGNTVSGIIVTIDAFGNLISNIDQTLIADFRKPVAQLAGHTMELVSTYGRVQPGEFLALINSFGVVEIARAEGNAAESLGSGRGAPVSIIDAG